MDIESIISDLLDGMTYRTISEKNGVPLSTFVDFISKPEHSARAKEALVLSAQTYEDMGEQVLLDINAESNGVEMARARELAQYYKWKARVRNPKRYGDKLSIGGDEDNPLITKVINLTNYTDDELRTIAELQRKGGVSEA